MTSNRYFSEDELLPKAKALVESAYNEGFNSLFQAHSNKWANIWKESDIVISEMNLLNKELDLTYSS